MLVYAYSRVIESPRSCFGRKKSGTGSAFPPSAGYHHHSRIATTDVITIDVFDFFAKVFIAKPFYRHVESNRGTSTIFETVS
jgi:hypothetical protein